MAGYDISFDTMICRYYACRKRYVVSKKTISRIQNKMQMSYLLTSEDKVWPSLFLFVNANHVWVVHRTPHQPLV